MKNLIEKCAIKTGKRLESSVISYTTQTKCFREEELKWDTVISSFESFYFSFHFPSGSSQVQEAQMTYEQASEMKKINNPCKAENQLLEDQSMLLGLVRRTS